MQNLDCGSQEIPITHLGFLVVDCGCLLKLFPVSLGLTGSFSAAQVPLDCDPEFALFCVRWSELVIGCVVSVHHVAGLSVL